MLPETTFCEPKLVPVINEGVSLIGMSNPEVTSITFISGSPVDPTPVKFISKGASLTSLFGMLIIAVFVPALAGSKVIVKVVDPPTAIGEGLDKPETV